MEIVQERLLLLFVVVNANDAWDSFLINLPVGCLSLCGSDREN